MDNSDLPDWLNFATDTQTFTGTHSNDDLGNLEINIQANDSSGATISDNFTLTVTPQPTDSRDLTDLTVYRFYNSSTGVHFYTADEAERDYAIDNLSNYNLEGESYASVDSITGGEEVHRFFNSQTGVHLYTTSEVERDSIRENLDNFSYEGVKFYAYETPLNNSIPVYRFYEPSLGVHFYTPDEAEKTFVQENLSNYNFEGIAYYAFPV